MTTPVAFSDLDRAWILARIDEVLRSGRLTLGQHTASFEGRFAQLCGRKHAVAVNSGTAALEIILRYFDVTGKEVIIPTNTFIATAVAVIRAGGIPRLVDVDHWMCLEPTHALKALTRRTAAVIVVHIGGQIAPGSAALRAICEEHGIPLVEDAAHAHLAALDSLVAGSIGAAAGFSFYPTKIMTTGEGGMVVTDDEELADFARCLRDQGKESFLSDRIAEVGYNWRMPELAAILGLRQVERLTEFIAKRRIIAETYMRELREVLTFLVSPVVSNAPNWYKVIALIPEGLDKAVCQAHLRARGLQMSGGVYDTPCHRQPTLARYLANSGREDFPVADSLAARHICLPISATMSQQDALRVADVIGDTLECLRLAR